MQQGSQWECPENITIDSSSLINRINSSLCKANVTKAHTGVHRAPCNKFDLQGCWYTNQIKSSKIEQSLPHEDAADVGPLLSLNLTRLA
jgi:hypothetical protein